MIVVTVIFTALICGTVIWMLHGIGRILMYEDQKNAIKDEDDFPPAR
jgi:uncharacterized integral membrane protein